MRTVLFAMIFVAAIVAAPLASAQPCFAHGECAPNGQPVDTVCEGVVLPVFNGVGNAWNSVFCH
jgi:hypothetical protein